MWKDPIVEEVRQVREAHAAQFDYDLRAIYMVIKEEETVSGRQYASLPPKQIRKRQTDQII